MTSIYVAGHSLVGQSARIPILTLETDFLNPLTYVLTCRMT